MSDYPKFDPMAVRIMSDLIQEFGLKDYQAAGALGNFGRETHGFEWLRERGARVGRGGYGWAQWTGKRAREFLKWCSDHRLDWQSYVANWTYLEHELKNEYAGVVRHLRQCENVDQAVESFEKYFEQAGVVAMDERKTFGHRALAAYRKAHTA